MGIISKDSDPRKTTKDKKVFEEELKKVLDRQMLLYGVDPDNPQEVSEHCSYGKDDNGVIVYFVDDQPIAYVVREKRLDGIGYLLYSVGRSIQ